MRRADGKGERPMHWQFVYNIWWYIRKLQWVLLNCSWLTFHPSPRLRYMLTKRRTWVPIDLLLLILVELYSSSMLKSLSIDKCDPFGSMFKIHPPIHSTSTILQLALSQLEVKSLWQIACIFLLTIVTFLKILIPYLIQLYIYFIYLLSVSVCITWVILPFSLNNISLPPITWVNIL
jgi:hypothetical protein